MDESRLGIGFVVRHFAGTRAELKRELENLLRAHSQATAVLTAPAGCAVASPARDAAAAPPSDPRFVIQCRIGESGMGTVYLALDRDHDARVALKTISRMNASSLLRFKNEFRALADVAHPNLVRLFELRSDGATWFFTMEYVDGTPFLHHVRRLAPDAQSDLGTTGADDPPASAPTGTDADAP
jgi:hypothetical protein